MLTVILTILKVLGIIIAVVIGLLLLIVLLVGFVPIRYKASVKYPEEGTLNEDVISRRKRDALMNKIKGSDEKEESEEPEEEEKKPLMIKANAVVSWLLHIVHATVDVDSSGMVINARLFGLFKIYSTDPEYVKKKEEKRKKKEEKRQKKEEKQKAKDKKKNEKEDLKEETKPVITSQGEEADKEAGKETPDKETDVKDADVKDADDKDEADVLDIDDDDEEDDEASDEYKGIKGKFKKIKDKIGKIKDKIRSVKEKIYHLNKKKNYILDMKDDERVRSGVGYAKDKFLLILKRILPKKLNGYVAFGMEDPASTGKILGSVSAFFPIWGEHVTLVPDFENKRLEVDADLKGRIMIALLVIPALKVWFNKDIKYIRKKVGKLKRM
ncbi:MAG: DUF2953 domain-containing protein [Lachnospiraceae bacterium]|nr:DUF2953 domain-containing protein [Lachnospiraceae bacterium]